MSEPKHSPSPWTVTERLSCWAVVDSNGQDLAYQDFAPSFHQGEPCGSIASRNRTRDELAENARLIAAAPELLEALRTLLVETDQHAESDCPKLLAACTAARAAIAKATATN